MMIKDNKVYNEVNFNSKVYNKGYLGTHLIFGDDSSGYVRQDYTRCKNDDDVSKLGSFIDLGLSLSDFADTQYLHIDTAAYWDCYNNDINHTRRSQDQYAVWFGMERYNDYYFNVNMHQYYRWGSDRSYAINYPQLYLSDKIVGTSEYDGNRWINGGGDINRTGRIDIDLYLEGDRYDYTVFNDSDVYHETGFLTDWIWNSTTPLCLFSGYNGNTGNGWLIKWFDITNHESQETVQNPIDIELIPVLKNKQHMMYDTVGHRYYSFPS